MGKTEEKSDVFILHSVFGNSWLSDVSPTNKTLSSLQHMPLTSCTCVCVSVFVCVINHHRDSVSRVVRLPYYKDLLLLNQLTLYVSTHTSSNSNLHQLQYKPCFAHTSYLCVKEKHRDTKTYTDITCGDTHTSDNDESSVIQHFYLHVSVGDRELDSIVSAHKHRHTHTDVHTHSQCS